jgi:DNA-directed RNA polymerase subunit N (RpoN/RPB10)
MIIPIKCFTCGKVIADKYRYYLEEVRKLKNNDNNDAVVYLTKTNTNKSPDGIVLDQLKINKICCRRHFITHVDID